MIDMYHKLTPNSLKAEFIYFSNGQLSQKYTDNYTGNRYFDKICYLLSLLRMHDINRVYKEVVTEQPYHPYSPAFAPCIAFIPSIQEQTRQVRC